MAYDRLVFRIHVIQRMFQRGINEHDVRRVVKTGEVIEEYPDDKPYASRLILGWCQSRPLHALAADNPEAQETIIITVYEPDLSQWEPGFRRRRMS